MRDGAQPEVAVKRWPAPKRSPAVLYPSPGPQELWERWQEPTQTLPLAIWGSIEIFSIFLSMVILLLVIWIQRNSNNHVVVVHLFPDQSLMINLCGLTDF